MSEQGIAQKSIPTIVGPSRQQILKATVIAAVVAGVILVTAVLPAEYGIDPLHTGAALGLSNLAKSRAATSEPPKAVTPVNVEGGITVVPPSASGEAPVIKGVYNAQAGSYKIDSREIKLGIGEGIEIKYHMQQKAGMLYSWTADKKVFYEFHGEPDVKPAGSPEDYFESYEKDDQAGAMESHGSFTAPSTGIHGWFWENGTNRPITIKLVTAGFYDYIMQNKDDVKTRLQPTELK